jgi:hypothetical protein
LSVDPSLSPSDALFVAALREAGLISELRHLELSRAASYMGEGDVASRRIDLLAAYYEVEGDPISSKRRQAMDRWFLYNANDGLTAITLVQRLSAIAPEMDPARLTRIGGSAGALVLQSGDHVCALEDEREDAPGSVSVSVRELVRAFNVLLDRHGVRTRLVGLVGDGRREAYLGQSTMGTAIQLANADYLTAPDGETLMQLAAW